MMKKRKQGRRLEIPVPAFVQSVNAPVSASQQACFGRSPRCNLERLSPVLPTHTTLKEDAMKKSMKCFLFLGLAALIHAGRPLAAAPPPPDEQKLERKARAIKKNTTADSSKIEVLA